VIAALEPILHSVVDGRVKGYPPARRPLRLGDIGSQRWSLLAGDLDPPVALLKASALDANEAWMGEFLRRTGASLCPHGKTSMAPQLFHRQLAAGAWGITVATARQARIAHDFGVTRLVLANEVAAAGAIAFIQGALDADPELDLTCLVDSVEGVQRLEAAARGRRPIDVLAEVGVPGGRTGARGAGAALAVARAARASPRLRLRGVECFEGIVGSADAAADRARVAAWLDEVAAVAERCAAEDLFERDEVLLSAGGSAWFDVVAERLSRVEVGRPRRVLLRSGCYAFHDVAHYARHAARLRDRLPAAWRVPGELEPAIEVWGAVVSRPEPRLAVIDVGKRDLGHDLDLPRPVRWARPGDAEPLREVGTGWSVASLYDQHARLTIPEDAELAVGDLVGCGVSHPCTTLDRWPLLFVVDDAYGVVEAIRTFF
jgi:D-serine dehydratase